MKIIDLVCRKGQTGFFFDDQAAIKSGAKVDGNVYLGQPVTEGFKSVRQAGEAICIMLLLDNGRFGYGDCVAVQYSGAGGRDPLFLAKDFIPIIEKEIRPLLIGKEISSFRNMAKIVDDYVTEDGQKLHTAIRYGVTQALLDITAKANQSLMCKVVAKEYGTKVSDKMIPIFSQSGDDRYLNADKMILKGVDVLPHGLFNTIDKVGRGGGLLLEYVYWLRDRILELRTDERYMPALHIDVYGIFSKIFNNDFEKIADFLGRLQEAAEPFKLRIEGPVDMGSREKQMEALRDIRILEEKIGIDVDLVADEWCNTFEDIVFFTDNKAGHMIQIKTPDLGGINNSIEAILYTKAKGMGSYLGGSCNESDRSAQICASIAMGASPDQILAKPGMGVDEGYVITYNHMKRILALKDKLGKDDW